MRARPVSGRKSLYLSSCIAGGIIGKPTPEARILLNDLKEHATQSRSVCGHKWKVNGNIARGTTARPCRRGRRYDESQPRDDALATTVAGDAPDSMQRRPPPTRRRLRSSAVAWPKPSSSVSVEARPAPVSSAAGGA